MANMPKSLTAGLGLRPRRYAGSACDDSADEAAYAAVVTPYKRTLTFYALPSFATSGHRLWNRLPEDITINTAPSLTMFRRRLKTHIFRQLVISGNNFVVGFWFFSPWWVVLAVICLCHLTQFGKRAYSVCSSVAWNSLPAAVRNIDS